LLRQRLAVAPHREQFWYLEAARVYFSGQRGGRQSTWGVPLAVEKELKKKGADVAAAVLGFM